jgi:hypothetical protein
MANDRLNINLLPYEKAADNGASIINIFDSITLENDEEKLSFNIALACNYIGTKTRYFVSAYIINKSESRIGFSRLLNFIIPDHQVCLPSEQTIVENELLRMHFDGIKMEKGIYYVKAFAVDVTEEKNLDLEFLRNKYYSREKLKPMIMNDENLIAVTSFEVK